MTRVNRMEKPHRPVLRGFVFSFFFMLIVSLVLNGCALFEKEMKALFQPMEADLRELFQPWYKEYGFKKLTDTQEFAAVPRLINALKDSNDVTRREAARILGNIGPDAFEAVPELINRLGDRSFHVRRQAAFALEKISPHDYPEVPKLILINALEDSNYLRAREAAIKLGQMGPAARPAVQALVRAMAQDGNWHENYRYVRVEAVKALGSIGPEAWPAVPSLINAMHALDPELRREAARTLGKIGPAAKDAVPILTECLDDMFVFPLSTRDLHKSINPFDEPTVAEWVDSIDVERINKQVHPVARHFLFDHAMRREAAWALGEIGPDARSAVPALVAVVNREPAGPTCDHEVRMESIRTLAKLGAAAGGSGEALAHIVETDSLKEVRLEALNALQRTGALSSEAVFTAIVKALKDVDPEIRVHAIRTLTAYEKNLAKGELIEWAPVDDMNVLGYIVCHTSGAQPEQCIDVGETTAFDIHALNPEQGRTYHFKVSAYDYNGKTNVIYRTTWLKKDVLSYLRVIMVEDMDEKVRMAAGQSVHDLMNLRGP